MWPKANPNQRPEHVETIDPDKTWLLGIVGFFTRYRGMLLTLATKLIAATGAWLFLNWHAALTVVVFGMGVLSCLFVTRMFFLRYVRCSERLHAIFHEFRDELPNILDTQVSESERSGNLRSLLDKFVNQMAAIYRLQFGDASVCCALRLLDTADATYVTKARSTGFEVSRKRNSEPIPVSKGLAKALREKDAQGVFLIPDIKTACEEGVWHPTKTDHLPDVRHLMVAPVNIVERGERQMLGILYLSSLNRRFSGPDTLAFKAFADYLGTMLALVAKTEIPHSPAKGKK